MLRGARRMAGTRVVCLLNRGLAADCFELGKFAMKNRSGPSNRPMRAET